MFKSLESKIRAVLLGENIDECMDDDRKKIKNVGRPDSGKEALGKQGQIKTKIIDEKMAIDSGLEDELMSQRQGESGKKWRVERAGKTVSTHNSKDEADAKAMKHPLNKVKTNEEVEELDELSKATLGRYIKKAATKIGTQGVTAGLKIAKDERSQKNFDTIGKRERGISTAVKKLTKEEQDFIDTLNNEEVEELDEGESKTGLPKSTAEKNKQYIEVTHLLGHKKKVPVHPTNAYKALNRYRNDPSTKSARIVSEDAEQIDELSRKTIGSYGSKALRAGLAGNKKHMAGSNLASAKLYPDQYKNSPLKAKVVAKEEVEELDEARGRPKKAGAKDFTIHPKTKEKLMHNNPEHMARIERLQKTGALQKPKTEANQHIIQQLNRAKTSMRGGETIHFTHGDSTHVSGTHAARLLDKYAGMKPHEKEAFQKKIGHSHANLKSEL